jgi:hypothetical protein
LLIPKGQYLLQHANYIISFSDERPIATQQKAKDKQIQPIPTNTKVGTGAVELIQAEIETLVIFVVLVGIETS